MPIYCENETDIAVNMSEIEDLAVFCLEFLRIPPQVEVNITFITEDYIAQLHEQWLDLPGPTDVMSFPVDEITPGSSLEEYVETPVLGDIVISPAFASIQAKEAGKELAQELQLLTVHGILHLTGYDHYEPDERTIMFALQEEILTKFNDHHNCDYVEKFE